MELILPFFLFLSWAALPVLLMEAVFLATCLILGLSFFFSSLFRGEK